eukprot:GEZU01004718.1.p2 GENE.GEZU01004718.1~~GEZU01004718.1.p2  ORF type:complete len:127 (+),score=32.87 GEZU01004718.1:132-512(+)
MVEPTWKMILSNKGILPILWEMFPNHPYLLPAYWSLKDADPATREAHVKKPLLGREGENVTICFGGDQQLWTDGRYEPTYVPPFAAAAGSKKVTEGKYIVQQAFIAPDFEGPVPVIGSWPRTRIIP